MTKERHLIALDLDGTLLTDEKKISPYTMDILMQAKEEGHILIISTGRPHRASINYYHELGLDTPMVNFNGALIHHPTNRNWDALHNPMPIRTAHKIIDACYDLSVNNILAEVMDDLYLDSYNEKIINFLGQMEDEPVYTIGNLKQKLDTDPTSILVYPDENQVGQLRDHLDDYHAEVIEHRKWGAPWNVIEIIKKGMNKAVGVDKIAYYFDIPVDRVIAFGDEDNDLEMIDYAGVGVAMDNGIDELKSIAKYTTGTNEEDGIGLFLKDYLKLNARSFG
ncbi:Cof-type HAD-IIB family hydrolase [Oceanobacillus sp. CAU 1775]